MREKRRESCWRLCTPDKYQLTIGEIDAEGWSTTDNHAPELLISQIKRGIAKPEAEKILCIPTTIEHPKRKDCKTLGQLFGNKSHKGNVTNLRTIPAEIRYRGKVNWRDQKIKDLILKWHNAGDSIRAIAEKLEITHQALTYANKKHHLYPPRKSPIHH